ncbi:hypothetical protein WA026_007865 [Henosepilachna vigintioctopunctata]|uniref:GIY-YIG homing endonuclease n=1 Tax=Henosepilachna vigintioctopunctata TaxID=420089 RepID=A0AAW1U3C1_9CUCU
MGDVQFGVVNNFMYSGTIINDKNKGKLENGHRIHYGQRENYNIENQIIKELISIGAQTNKNRPVVVSLTTIWKKHLLSENKSNLPHSIYIKEDYPKHILEIRKQLQPNVEEERKKGNLAYIKHGKLIVKQLNDLGPEKRKREQIGTPNSPTHKRSKPNKTRISSATNTKNAIKPNLLNYVARGRSN